MVRKPLNFIYGSMPATFESQFGLGESVRRLEAATKRTSFSALQSQAAVGRVSETKVVLQRAIPLVGNSFKPFFVGRFERTRTGVVLQGRFTMHWFVKAFLTYWFGFCVLWVAMATYSVASSRPSEEWWLPLAGVGMFCAGLGLVWTGKYFARNDVSWLSNVIQAALSAEVRPDNSSKPTPLRGAA